MLWYREAFFLFLTSLVTGDVQIYPQFGVPHIVADFVDIPASFGEIIPPKGISALVVYANPDNACTSIDPPPSNVTNLTNRWAVLIRRYNCSFEKKVLNAQNASFDVVIIHNVNSNKLERMTSKDPDKIHIPSIFVSANTGRAIKNKYQYFDGFFIQISEDSPWDYNTRIFIPFLIVILLCSFSIIGFMVAKCIKDHRRARRRRLPHSSLLKIPITKFRKGDPYETCAICLDDFVEGEKLRILPCSHAYHCNCIDPWLTRNRRVCPMCKRKVFAQNEQINDDSMSEDDDQTPLLRSAQRTNGGTFATRENAFIQTIERNLIPSTSSVEERSGNNDERSVESGLVSNCCTGNYQGGNHCGSHCSSNEQYFWCIQIPPDVTFIPGNANSDVPSVTTSSANNESDINDLSCYICTNSERPHLDDDDQPQQQSSHSSLIEEPGNIN